MLQVAEAVERTDTGRQREANEDSYFSRSPVFAVADGMGGAQAGEVASRIAVEAFEPERDSLAARRGATSSRPRWTANRAIYELAQGDEVALGDGDDADRGAGRAATRSASATSATAAPTCCATASSSSSPTTTRWSRSWRRQGTADRASRPPSIPQRSVITRALGPEPEVDVDTMTVRARPRRRLPALLRRADDDARRRGPRRRSSPAGGDLDRTRAAAGRRRERARRPRQHHRRPLPR